MVDQVDETCNLKRKSEQVLERESPDKKVCNNDNVLDIKLNYSFNKNDNSQSIQYVDIDDAKDNMKVKTASNQGDVNSSALQDFNSDEKNEEQELESEKEVIEGFSEKYTEKQKSELDCKENSNENLDLELKPAEKNTDTNSQINSNANSDNLNQDTNSQVNSNANNDNLDQATANTQLPVPRQKCKYGSQCYRLSADHKVKFSHPGDTDYDVPDNRPECPYGLDCYRKNPQHKLDYKHTVSKRKRTQVTARPASPQDLSDLEDSWEESVDESDYEPSFIDDDSIEELESDVDVNDE